MAKRSHSMQVEATHSVNRGAESPQLPDQGSASQENTLLSAICTFVFFLLFYIYVWLVIDPRLQHHCLGLVCPYHCVSYTTEWSFFWQCVSRPGGVVDDGARFLWQFFAYDWMGALIVTAAAWTTSLAVDVLTRIADRPRAMVVRFAPAVLLVVICGRYEQPLKSVLSLLVALVCSMAYLRWGSRGGGGRSGALLVVTSVVAFLLAGSGGLLFPCLAAIFEFIHRRRGLVGLVALLCVAGVPLIVGAAVFRIPFGEQFWSFLAFGRAEGPTELALRRAIPLLPGCIRRICLESSPANRPGFDKKETQEVGGGLAPENADFSFPAGGRIQIRDQPGRCLLDRRRNRLEYAR